MGAYNCVTKVLFKKPLAMILERPECCQDGFVYLFIYLIRSSNLDANVHRMIWQIAKTYLLLYRP